DVRAIHKIADSEPDILSDVLRETDNLEVLTYLMYLYQRFGKSVFNQIIGDLGGDITIRKTVTLEEQHIYGSSRHGLHKPRRLLAAKSFALEEIGEEGGLSTIGSAVDSTLYSVSSHYFSRTLAMKQYELSNHLGNVLATVLDRKTAIIDEAGGDTLLYYVADVSTAQYYYSFGSAIPELSYLHANGIDTARYRYGFNNQEKDTELGDYYSFEYRVHDTRLGRFLSVDPASRYFGQYSVYSFA